jgi:hypothetical protein
MAKERTETHRKCYMECKKKLQLGFDTSVQEKAHKSQQFELCLFII